MSSNKIYQLVRLDETSKLMCISLENFESLYVICLTFIDFFSTVKNYRDYGSQFMALSP